MEFDSVAQEKFTALVDRSGGPESCWLWLGRKNKPGYGAFSDKGKAFRAHRIAYLLHYGVDPGQFLVCHSCDNPSCCNPRHLFLGTSQDNVDDMVKKGRVRGNVRSLGSENINSKLTEDLVREIRESYSKGKVGYKALGKKYGVANTVIRDIVKGRLWGHVK